MLINLLEPEDLGSKQLADLVQPTTDVDTTVRQVFQSRTDEVPIFPYTETPILPPEVYRKGLSSREKLQELPGMDPIFVVKKPTLFRTRPAGVKLPADCLRTSEHLDLSPWEVGNRLRIVFHHCYNNHVLTNGSNGHVSSITILLPLRLSHCP